MLVSLPRRPKAVIFDMDGTLLGTEAVHRVAMQAAAKSMGHELSEEMFAATVGVHREKNRSAMLQYFGDDFALDAFYFDADERFERLWRAGVPFRPGAIPLLDLIAKAGLPMAIATSTSSPFAEQRLALAGIADRFAAIVTLSDVGNPKPHAEPYLRAAAMLGFAARDCVAVEDSPNGLRAAIAAETMAVLIPDLIPETAESVNAVAVLPDLHSLAEVIANSLDLP